MPAASSVGIRVQAAVCAMRCTRPGEHRCDAHCTFPSELRHYVMVLAVLAHRGTGIGTAGQERIAEAMGVTVRSVQRLAAQLEARTDSPVIIVRRRRRRKDGYRTSDEYRLVLRSPDAGDGRGDTNAERAHPTQTTGESPDARDGCESGSHPTRVTTLPDTGDDLTRRPRHPSDPGSDPRSDPGRSVAKPKSDRGKSNTRGAPATPRNQKRQAAKRKTGEHRRVVEHYVALYEQARGERPAFGGRDARDAATLLAAFAGDADRVCTLLDGAFADPFWRSKLTLRMIAADPARFQNARGAHAPQPSGGSFDAASAGQASWLDPNGGAA